MALPGPTSVSGPPVQGGFRLPYLGPLVSYLDRFALPPLLLSVARDLDHSLATTSVLATFYFFAYGLMQLFRGLLSDRVGRVRVMRWALAGMAVANLVAAAAPSLSVLVVAKAVAGAFAAALLPAAMAYVADAVPFDRRQQVIANIMAAGAIGTVTGTVTAGLLSGLATWRLAFLVTVPFAFGLAVAFRRLPESRPECPARRGFFAGAAGPGPPVGVVPACRRRAGRRCCARLPHLPGPCPGGARRVRRSPAWWSRRTGSLSSSRHRL